MFKELEDIETINKGQPIHHLMYILSDGPQTAERASHEVLLRDVSA